MPFPLKRRNCHTVVTCLTCNGFVLILFFLLTLVACGGSDGGGSSGHSQQTPQQVVAGQAVLGPLCGADVMLYPAGDLQNPIFTTTTDNTLDLNIGGAFSLPDNLLEDDELYVVAVSGGTDIDADDDGVIDNPVTRNNGIIHLVALGSDLKRGDFTVNILTEMVYGQVAYQLAAQAAPRKIIDEMNRCAELLLTDDVDGDSGIGYLDLAAWHPLEHSDHLRQPDNVKSLRALVLDGENIALQAAGQLAGISAHVATPAAYGVEISADHLFAVDFENGLMAIDVTDPENPEQVGNIASRGYYDVALATNGYAYAADQSVSEDDPTTGLAVIDISRPDSLSLETTAETLGVPFGVAVSGNYACVAYKADTAAGIQIFNIEDPAVPVSVGSVEGFTSPHGLTVSDHYLYVSDLDSGFHIVDISNPGDLIVVGSLSFFGCASSFVSGDHAYIASPDVGVVVLDVGSPETINDDYEKIVSYTATNGNAWRLWRQGNLVYVADDTAGVQVVDFTDLSYPIWIGGLDTPGEAYGVVLAGATLYVADGSQGVQIVDPEQIPVPSFLGALSTPGFAYASALSDHFLYLADLYSVQVIDVADPAAPVIAGEIATDGFAYAVAMADQKAYVAASEAGLQIFSVADPGAPVALGTVDTPGDASGVAVRGGYAYVADFDGGLQVVNISDSNAYGIEGSVSTTGYARAVALSGNFAFVAADTAGLKIVDISIPQSPLEVATADTPGYAVAVALNGNYAYVCDLGMGTEMPSLQIMDISDPLDPHVAGELELPGDCYSVAVSGKYAYLAGWDKGVLMVDVQDPTAPLLVGYSDTPGLVAGVTIDDGYAYIADYTAGLKIEAIAR